ncbi:MAG: alpha/beta hydrolase [Deltaproteobacteria bacterium]|nr:alpha/beta hydrolase [Deltaproteobacteria bacterium]
MNRPNVDPIRGALIGKLITGFIHGASALARLHPAARASRHGVEVLENISYRPGGQSDHLLDVYRPIKREGLLPIVLYIHGGGFRLGSKNTHWMMGLHYARRGYCVFNINYRLAPQYRFPAAPHDAIDAYLWVAENAARYGGDPQRLILAGESAGANLALGLSIASSYRLDSGRAESIYRCAVRPRALIAGCGFLQVSDTNRYRRQGLARWALDRVNYIEQSYAPLVSDAEDQTLLDPLNFLEDAKQPERDFPPTLVPVGGRDPVFDDSRRLNAALERLAIAHRFLRYEGEGHAFFAFVWREQAKRCWRDIFNFLEQQGLAGEPR